MVNSKLKKYVYKYLCKKEPVIVEVGGHFGEDTVDMLDVMSPSVIYCFEPDTRNLQVLKDYVKDARVIIIEKAVSDEHNQTKTFYQGYSPDIKPKMFKKYHWINRDKYVDMKLNASGASSLKYGHPLVENTNQIDVKTVRLDRWAEHYKVNHVDFLWVDVQGAEKEVIWGLGKFAAQVTSIWIEYGETQYEGAIDRRSTVELLSKIGFYADKKKSDRGKKGNLLFWKIGQGPNS